MSDFLDIAAHINLVVNAFSAVGAILVVTAILGGMAMDSKTMDRVSIRFTLAISIVDFFKAIVNILGAQIELDILSCTLLDTFNQWLDLFYLFLNVSIAVNLQLVFIHGFSFNAMWERTYWMVSFGLSVFLSLFPIGIPLYGWGVNPSGMRGRYSKPGATSMALGAVFVLGAFDVHHCSIIIMLIIVKLTKNERNLNHALNMNACSNKVDDWRSLRYNSVIKALIRRVTLYCVIPVVTHVGYFVYHVHEFHTKKRRLPGVLNFLAFLMDPVFQKTMAAFKLYRESSKRSKTSEKISYAQPTSHNATQELFIFSPSEVPKSNIQRASFPASTPHPSNNPPAFPDLRSSLPHELTPIIQNPSKDIVEVQEAPEYELATISRVNQEKYSSWNLDPNASVSLPEASDSQFYDDTPTLLTCAKERRVSAFMKCL
ncbi:hypothetical protein L0F63_001242 [Massospora cicadina]|nr:hypothetical protein L0F63_001242 [Massospora cicadina]